MGDWDEPTIAVIGLLIGIFCGASIMLILTWGMDERRLVKCERENNVFRCEKHYKPIAPDA